MTTATVRFASPEFDELTSLIFRRYPRFEWATFARFGWRETTDGLVLTLASILPPGEGDIDPRVGHVAIQEPYTLRVALDAEKQPLAVGVIHSHPANCAPRPSPTDDDMDGYYSDYLRGFAPLRPYVSLIISKIEGELACSGRVFWNERWLIVHRFLVERTPVQTWVRGERPAPIGSPHERTKRLAKAFGDDAAARLRRASVAVIGAGGTGSAAIEVLARAGVGRLIVVDPDFLEPSNLERVHGAFSADATQNVPKVAIARRHVEAIDPSCDVVALIGAVPQRDVLDAICTADIALGCTDQQHSRLALSDISVRYLIPSIDCGVMLEGGDGHVTGQVAQIVRFLAADPCALCRDMAAPARLQQELVPDDERAQRRAAAVAATARGENPNPYWHELPQLNTVGYLTTMAGSLVAGYAIGWITGRFDPPFERLQMNVVAPFLDVTDSRTVPRQDCTCRRVRGWADQAIVDAFISPPEHWPAVRRV